MINFVTNPVNPPRQIFSVGDAQSQFQPFSDVYRQVWDFIEDGGLEAFGLNEGDLATWRRNIREGIVNIGGKPSEIDFFRMMMGGTPKPTDASTISVRYNSALDYNIYSENDAVGTSGAVTNAWFGDLQDGTYTGPYALFTLAADTYSDNGRKSNINLGDQIFNYIDGRMMIVIKVNKTVAFAHQVWVVPFDEDYTIAIYAKQPMQPLHVNLTTGYSDGVTSQPHSEWETLGYTKAYSPWSLRTDWESPRDLSKPYKDVLQFAIIFDLVDGSEMSAWDFKSMADARERLIMAENMHFFTGEVLTNVALTVNSYTNKYHGFEGLMTTIWYGGGNIQQYDNSYGYDLDVDFMQMVFSNDAMKKSQEFLFLAAKKWIWQMERRSQNMFQNNSGACTFDTFERMGEERADLKRLGINSYEWRGSTMHIKEVGAWSDARWIGNTYFPAMALILPGDGLTDSKGNKVSPVEYWIPSGTRLSGTWTEIWRDHMQMSDKADKFSGTITHDIMMSVNGVENMWSSMPKYIVSNS